MIYDPSANDLTVLRAYADATEPMERHDAVKLLLPVEPANWGSRAHREWLRRRKSLERAATTLEWRGLLDELPDGRCVISDAGRRALTEAVSN